MNEATRESICHWLSKSGELSAHHDELLQFSKAADQQEVVDLYAYLAGNSERFESEWRQEFESIFSTHAGALPEVCEADQWSEVLHQFVESGDLTKVKTFIAQIGIESWPLPPGEMIEDGIYPVEQEDENGEVPIEKAKRLGHTTLATYLETILSRFRP